VAGLETGLLMVVISITHGPHESFCSCISHFTHLS